MTNEEVKRLLAFYESNFGTLPSRQWQKTAIQKIRTWSNACWVTTENNKRFMAERNVRGVLCFRTEEQVEERIIKANRRIEEMKERIYQKSLKKQYKPKEVDISGAKAFSPVKWRT